MRALAAQVRDLTVAILQRGNEIAAARGILLADTKVEFGLRGRRGRAGRRGAHPRLLAVLAGRPVGARPRPAELRQAVRARLADLAGLGLVEVVGGGPAAAARRRRRRRPGRSTSRPTSGSPARPSDAPGLVERRQHAGMQASHPPRVASTRPAPSAIRRTCVRTISVQLAMATSAAARSPVTATSKSSPRAIASDCRASVRCPRPAAARAARTAWSARRASRCAARPAAPGGVRLPAHRVRRDSSKNSGAKTSARSATRAQNAEHRPRTGRRGCADQLERARRAHACSTASTTAPSRPSREPKW